MILQLFLALSIGAAPASAAPETKIPTSVLATKLQAQELADLLSYPARVVPKINTVILAETDGIVNRIFAPLGSAISRNRPVLTITHTDPVYKYAPMQVVSPIHGIVSSMDVTEGTQVSKGQRLGSITDPKKIRLTVEIPAQDLPALSAGQKGEFRISGAADPIAVTLRGVSPFVDPGTGTASAELETAAKTLTPGLVGQVTFKANVRTGITIPDHAVNYRGNETFVRLVVAGKSKRQFVSVGKKQRGMVEVLKGLESGQVLIERTGRHLNDGDAVTVQTASSDKAK